jgi:hypothetical protein
VTWSIKYIPFVSYGCKTWSQTLREERRWRVTENRGLRRVFGLTREKQTVYWRKLHNEELHNLYSSLNIVRLIKCRACSMHGRYVKSKWNLEQKTRKEETTWKILDMNGRIILKCTVGGGLYSSRSSGPVADFCEHGNEPLRSLQSREFD